MVCYDVTSTNLLEALFRIKKLLQSHETIDLSVSISNQAPELAESLYKCLILTGIIASWTEIQRVQHRSRDHVTCLRKSVLA
jgi:hypothetical protein